LKRPSLLDYHEHNPLLYKDTGEMTEYISQVVRCSKEATVLLYAHGTDTFLEDLTRNADRVFYLDERPRATTSSSLRVKPSVRIRVGRKNS